MVKPVYDLMVFLDRPPVVRIHVRQQHQLGFTAYTTERNA